MIQEGGREMPVGVYVLRYLEGVGYPASRDTLIEHACRQGADDVAMEALRQLPEGNFNDPAAVSGAIAVQQS
jgi:hypothetical protein